MLDQLNLRASRGYVAAFWHSIVYAGLGDVEAAIGHLERSYAQSDVWLVCAQYGTSVGQRAVRRSIPATPSARRLRRSGRWSLRPAGLRLFSFTGEFVRTAELIPAAPADNAQFRLGSIGQHREQLEQIPIGVAEVERCSGHPCQNDRLPGRLPFEIQGNNISSPEPRRRHQQVFEIHSEGQVKIQPLRTGPDLPQTQHRVAVPTDPVERNPPLPKHFREFQSEDLGKESHRALQVCNVQMAFEEIANWPQRGWHICLMRSLASKSQTRGRLD